MPLKEFELLEILLRNTGRVMTRAQLIAAIDHARPAPVGLATAIRLFLLAEARAGRLERPREGD